jgi:carbon monoxide dehydrogenase subunit G
VPVRSVKVALNSKDVGPSSDVEGVLAVSPQDGGTRLHWTADGTHLVGLLTTVPKGLVRSAAQKVIAEVLDALPAKRAEAGQ